MAITGPGLYGLTLVKYLTNAAALDLGAENNKIAMVQDGYTPDYNLHDFYADLTNEVSGTGYTAGGAVLTGTTVTAASGLVTFDASNPTWASSTITDAMGGVIYHDLVTDELVCLMDFVTAASSSGGTFTIEIAGTGIFTLDYIP